MPDKKDFFISYTSADVRWAEWIAWTLEAEGYQVVIQKWDFQTGDNFFADMDNALRECERTLLVTSPAYFASKYAKMEWTAALKRDRVIPVRVEKTNEVSLLDPISYINLVGLPEEEARKLLLANVLPGRKKPKTKPGFPGSAVHTVTKPTRFPGQEPAIWGIPLLRNPHFTGREEILSALHTNLSGNQGAVLTQAIKGLGGIGKTQLALEYAYRYRSEYEIVWWINAEETQSMASGFSALARELGIPEQQEQDLVTQAVKKALQTRTNWLLIFDNVTEERDVLPYIPGAGSGDILVTSRSSTWKRLTPLPVSTWKREESVDFLLTRTGRGDKAGASSLAERLGDLPLALEQAVAYMEDTLMPFQEYLHLFTERRAALLAEAEAPLDYTHTVATTWELSMKKVHEAAPAGLDALKLFSFLAPDNIPRSFLESVSEHLPDDSHTALADSIERAKAIKALRRFSLVEITENTCSIHRLVQHVVRDALEEEENRIWAEGAIGLVTDRWPGGTFDHRAWPECEALLPHATQCIQEAEAFGIETEKVGLLASRMGFYLMDRAFYNKAEPLFEKALAIYQTVLGENHPYTAQSYNNLAGLYESQGLYQKAEPLYQKALDIYQSVLGQNHPDTSISYNNLAVLYYSQGLYQKAEPLYQKALAIRETVLGENHPDTASSYNNLAELYRIQGLYQKAEPLLEKALGIDQTVLGENHPNTAIDYNNLALLYYHQGLYQKAEPLYQKALAIRETVLGENHPDTASSYNNLAALYRIQGLFEKAEPLFEKALAIRETVLGENHPSTATSYNNLAALYESQGLYQKAEPLYQKALDIQERVLGENHPDTTASYNNLAALYENQGLYQKAEPLYQKALEIDQTVLGENHPNTAIDYNNLAGLYESQGLYQKAEPLLEKALAIFQSVLGENHPSTAIVRKNLARVKEHTGK